MLKLSAVAHTQKKITNQDREWFLFHHPYIEMVLCGILVPMVALVAVTTLCYAVMLPISFFMGWL